MRRLRDVRMSTGLSLRISIVDGRPRRPRRLKLPSMKLGSSIECAIWYFRQMAIVPKLKVSTRRPSLMAASLARCVRLLWFVLLARRRWPSSSIRTCSPYPSSTASTCRPTSIAGSASSTSSTSISWTSTAHSALAASRAG
eukprot:6837433-Prymnesium_polylepis.1